MKNPFASPTSTSLGLLIVRIPLGVLFICAGWSKIFQTGIGKFVAFSAPNLPHFVPDYLGKTYLYLFPFFELGMGLLVLLGLWTRLAAFILTLMLISIIWAITGIHQSPMPYHPNVMFLAVAILLFLAGGGTFTIDRIIKAGSSGSKSPAK
jgi:putative oxidoreductase